MTQKTIFLRSDLGSSSIILTVTIGMALKFYSSVAKEVRKFLRANSHFWRRYMGKTGKGDIFVPRLNLDRARINVMHIS